MQKRTDTENYTLVNIPRDTESFKKPRNQRPRKWTHQYEKDWIGFLEISLNPIHHFIISNTNEQSYLIDGGNRYDTIIRFCKAPFGVMDNYLKEISNYLNDSNIENIDIFLNYLEEQDINTLLLIHEESHLQSHLQSYNNNNNIDVNLCFNILQPYLDRLHTLSRISFTFTFYRNYTQDEMNNIYLSINKASTKITPLENHFGHNQENWIILNNRNFKEKVIEEVKLFYKTINDNEEIECYTYAEGDDINISEGLLSIHNILCNDQNYVLFKKNIKNLEGDNLPSTFNLFNILYNNDNNRLFEFYTNLKSCCDFFKNHISDYVENKKVLDTFKGDTKLSLIFAYLLGHMNKFNDTNFIRKFKYSINIHILGEASKKIHIEPLNKNIDDFKLDGGGICKDAKIREYNNNTYNIRSHPINNLRNFFNNEPDLKEKSEQTTQYRNYIIIKPILEELLKEFTNNN